MTGRLPIRLAVLMLLCLGAGTAHAAEPVWIDHVKWAGDPPYSAKRLEEVSGLLPGARLTPESLATAIRELSRLPEVKTVQAQTIPTSPGRVRVEVRLTRVERMARLQVRGARKIRPDQIFRISRLRLRGEIDPERLEEAAERIREAYAQRGYFNTTVRMEVTGFSEVMPGRVTVTAWVDEGERSRVDRIRFPGFPGADGSGDLPGVRQSMRAGKPFDESKLQRDMGRIRKHLVREGYLHPQVGPYSLDRSEGRLEVVVPVRVREKIRVIVNGNRRYSDRKIAAILNLSEQRVIDEAVLSEATSRLLERFAEDGFHDGEVTISSERQPGKPIYDIIVEVREGYRYRTYDVRFEGNRTFSDRDLWELVRPSAWRIRPEPVRKQVIAERARRIEAIFRAAGHRDASVTVLLDRVPRRRGRMIVTYRVDEGKRAWVKQVRVVGAEELDGKIREALAAQVGVLEGRPYRRDQIRNARSALLKTLGEFGYVDAEVETEQVWEGQFTDGLDDKGKPIQVWEEGRWRGLVDLDGTPLREDFLSATFHVEPGMQVRFGTVSVDGDYRTRPHVIQRELAIREGELYTPSAIAETRRNLFRAAAFDQVTVEPVNPADRGPVRDMVVRISEGRPGVFELGLGYAEKDGLRGLIDLSYRDMFRRGHRAGLRLRAGQLRRQAALTYTLPWVGPFRADLRSRILLEEEEQVSYQRRTLAAEIGMRRAISRHVTLNVGYRLERNQFTNQPVTERPRINVGSLLGSIIRDSRDDPFTPRRGTVLGASYEQAARALASEVQFAKGQVHMAAFKGVSRSIVFAGNFRTGRARKLFDSLDVPISERFFVGGQTTIRGYSLDSVGVPGETISGTGSILGGDVMLLANLEIRAGGREGVGIVLFADAGNVWNHGSTIGAGDVRVGAGPGLFYATPIGPIRLDLGYKVDRRKGEDPYRVHFTIGHTF